MKYDRTELRDPLAGAYVIGTLRGRARARFERACAANEVLAAAVRRWEDELIAFDRNLVPANPSPGVWLGISRRTMSTSEVTKRRAAPWRWALVGAFSLAVLIALSLRLLYPPYQVVAAVGPDQSHPLWSVSRSANSGTMAIRALQSVQADPRHAYELWALPRRGGPPVSLGLMPRSGVVTRVLIESQRVALLGAEKLAVSIEPAGGSPTGSPTGPVVFIAVVRQPS